MDTSILIKKSARLLEKKANVLLKPHRLTYGFTYFLMALYDKNGLTQTELQKIIGIEQPTVVRTLDRMARNGLIVRRSSSKDRRVFHIYLTERAISCKSIVLSTSANLNKILLSGLNEDEKAMLHKHLQRLVVNLE